MHMYGNTRNTDDFLCSGTKRLLTIFLLISLSTWGEGNEMAGPESKVSTHYPKKRAAHPVDHNLTGLNQVRISTRFVQRQLSTNYFFQNHQESQPIASGHEIIHIPVPYPIWGFYYDICDCHILRARAWTPALNVCTCTCTKPNSSKPN